MTAQSIFEEAFGRPDPGRNDKNEEASLTGTVEEVIFSREDTGFLIISLEGEDGGMYSALGIMPDVKEGDLLKLGEGGSIMHATGGSSALRLTSVSCRPTTRLSRGILPPAQ